MKLEIGMGGVMVKCKKSKFQFFHIQKCLLSNLDIYYRRHIPLPPGLGKGVSIDQRGAWYTCKGVRNLANGMMEVKICEKKNMSEYVQS